VHDSLHQAGLAFRRDHNKDVVVLVKPGADKREFDAGLLGDVPIGNAARIGVNPAERIRTRPLWQWQARAALMRSRTTGSQCSPYVA
jgi:hypothetical protein